MASVVTCACGRKFHIGNSAAGFQCRNCGRWWSGHEAGLGSLIVASVLGVEVARTERKHGAYWQRSEQGYRTRQTNRKPPRRCPITSIVRYFLG
jgi:hypothetical protein